jgi:sulfite exporter TauE/SafE
MTEGLDFSLALMTGILGSGHCIGMCGALVSGFFMSTGKHTRNYLPYLAYHGMRIFVYTVVGIIAATLGVVLVSTGLVGKIQGFLQIVVGALVIILALLPTRVLSRGFAKAAASGTMGGAALGGLVNGLMPCSLTLAMAVKATTAETFFEGGLLMFTFGLGTLPSMVFVSMAFGKLGTGVRGLMLKIAALIVFIMGVGTLYQGIAYFSVMKNLANW